MPSKYFSEPKLLHSLAGFFLNQGQNSVLANAGLSISKKSFSTLNNSIRPVHMLDFRPVLSPTGLLPHSNTMFAFSSLSDGSELLSAHQLEGLEWKSGQISSPLMSSVDYSRKSTRSLKSQDLWDNHLVYRGSLAASMGTYSKFNMFMDVRRKDFHTSRSAAYSTGAVPDVLIDGALQEEQIGDSRSSSDRTLPGDRTLKLLSGSCYLRHPDKDDTGGEDAHFICADEHDAVVVADCVGGWGDLGVDAGQYARELMSHSVTAIQEEPRGSIDPTRELEKAYTSTKAKGSSTACIIALSNQGIHPVNIGDSGFIIVREGCTIFCSPVQQHDFNFTYQLESGNGCDIPSAAQVFTVPVAAGDVIIAGTDGLFDNLYNNEVTAVVVHAVRAGVGPQVTAQKIAALARQQTMDKERQTPFSTAAQDAGYRYYGGKLDDSTVVVSCIAASTP